ncbi:ABC transporter [Xylariaceae sp. AK1471]|nr:ABC transporter [Xylariaceae sp. AK1471]
MRNSTIAGWWLTLFKNIFDTQPNRTCCSVVEGDSHPSIGWVCKVHKLARQGNLQAGLILLTILWTLKCALSRSQSLAYTRPSQRILSYELASQAARAVALALIIVSATLVEGHWANVATVGYAFLSGLLRLFGSIRYRHLFLHQANFLVLVSLLILIASEVLPLAVLESPFSLNLWVLGAMLALTGAILIALVTPRAWSSPFLDHNLDPRAPEPKPSVEETCSWFSYYFSFGYLTPLIWKGSRTPVEMTDLPGLPGYDEPLKLLTIVLGAREQSKQSTLWTLLRYQNRELLAMAAWIILAFSIELIGPYTLYNLLAYLGDPDGATVHPAVWLFLMFAGPMSRTVCYQQYQFSSTRLLVRVKSGFIQELYHRAMTSMELEEDVINKIENKNIKKETRKSTSIGRLANLMSSDVAAVCQARDFIMVLTGIPAGTILSFVGLYKVIGWPAIIGTVFMMAMTIVPAYIAQVMGKTQREVKIAQDSRISLITEYLSSIKAIKYFAWEDTMMTHIQEARGKEQKGLWRITLLLVTMAEIGDLIPVFTLAFIFAMYTGILKQPLTAPAAFTTLSLLSNIRRNINWINFYSRSAVNGWVSMQRLDRYFQSTTPLLSYPVGPLSLRKATFRRNKSATFFLKDITLDFIEGGLNVVSGQSGSGKTTLLLAVLGETILESGAVTRPDDVAFASQTPWLQSGTVRDNIVFCSEFEQARYDRVIQACALKVDLDDLPLGDQTDVGENGTALSGGQQARVALARTLYSKASLLLLDDTFSALDTKTAATIWEQCFCGNLLEGRTTILITQMPWILAQADLSVVLENGQIRCTEQNLGIIRKPVALEDGGVEERKIGADGANSAVGGSGVANRSDVSSAAPPCPDLSKKKADDIAEEMKATGKMNRLSFFKYMLYFGGPGYVVFAVFTTLLVNVIFVGTGYWLSLWVNAYGQQEHVDISFYLGIYAAFTVSSVLFDAVSFLTYANGAWIAAKRLHMACLRSVMNVSLAWWKTVPVGRVVNRFSKDVASLDNTLSHMVQVFLETAMKIFFRLGAISSILPIFIVPGLASCFLGVFAGEMYSRTAVVVRRLVSSSQSPVFSQFSDSMAGLAVIRARGGMSRVFGEKLAERLREFSRAQEANANINRWVAVRIDLIAALVSACAGLIAVSKADQLTAGLVGFSLTNAIGLSDTILMVIRSMNELEVEMQSFHRLVEYTEMEPEDKMDDAHQEESRATKTHANHQRRAIPKSWPASGAVELKNVTVKYDGDGPDILKNINLKFAAGERVAVVGRTGSGKSTLVLTLLRFTNIVEGKIFYDGVDITTIPRKKLRQALTVIPQEPTLFSGTVGSNLDPTGDRPASQLHSAIDSCAETAAFQFHFSEETTTESITQNRNGTGKGPHTTTEATPLLSAVETGSGHGRTKPASRVSLSTVVQAKGENFSHGQRQVLSLCRAIVRRSKLMLLDEATASVDHQTDQSMQAILRADLGEVGEESRTLITIAHRLRTVVNYDKVVVLGAGRVLEYGSPAELYKSRGYFFDMVQHSGEEENLAALWRDGGTEEEQKIPLSS